MSKLPKTISTTRTFTYDVEDIARSLIEYDVDMTLEDVTLEQVLEVVLGWAYDDLRSPIEHDPLLVDENGNELN